MCMTIREGSGISACVGLVIGVLIARRDIRTVMTETDAGATHATGLFASLRNFAATLTAVAQTSWSCWRMK